MKALCIVLYIISFIVYVFALSMLRNYGKKEWTYGFVASFAAAVFTIACFLK